MGRTSTHKLSMDRENWLHSGHIQGAHPPQAFYGQRELAAQWTYTGRTSTTSFLWTERTGCIVDIYREDIHHKLSMDRENWLHSGHIQGTHPPQAFYGQRELAAQWTYIGSTSTTSFLWTERTGCMVNIYREHIHHKLSMDRENWLHSGHTQGAHPPQAFYGQRELAAQWTYIGRTSTHKLSMDRENWLHSGHIQGGHPLQAFYGERELAAQWTYIGRTSTTSFLWTERTGCIVDIYREDIHHKLSMDRENWLHSGHIQGGHPPQAFYGERELAAQWIYIGSTSTTSFLWTERTGCMVNIY